MTAAIYGLHNIYNILAAIAAADVMGISLENIQQALATVEIADARSQIIENGYLVINDTYNSNPLSSRVALESVVRTFPDRTRIAVLSDMKELGQAAKQSHEEIGAASHTNKIDLLYLYGEHADDYLNGALAAGMHESQVAVFESKDELTAALLHRIDDNCVILVKGSRSTKMEDIVNSLI